VVEIGQMHPHSVGESGFRYLLCRAVRIDAPRRASIKVVRQSPVLDDGSNARVLKAFL